MLKNIHTPVQLMEYLDENIEYGVIDKNGNKFTDSSSEKFQFVCNNEWFLRPVQQILLDKIGHCYDQVEIENSGFSHTYLLFKENNQWKLFEHSDYYNRGIFSFNSLNEAIIFQAKNQIKTAEKCVKPEKRYSVCIKEYSKPKTNLNMTEFLEFINNSKDINVNMF